MGVLSRYQTGVNQPLALTGGPVGERIPYHPAVADYQTLSLERDPRRPEVLHVWLDRPRRRNAVNARMMSEVGDVFEALQRDFDTRVVVLGGRGLSFCTGSEMSITGRHAANPRRIAG